jgi:hypothetical protein
MPHRTDAAGRTRKVAWLLLLTTSAGCNVIAKPAPSSQPKLPPVAGRPAPVTLPTGAPLTPIQPLAHATPLAIAAPAEDVKPVSFQAPAAPSVPPVADAPGSPTSSDTDPVRRLHRDAAAAYAKQGSYIARLRRRESVPGRAKPEEILLFKFREQPWSVHFKWLGDEGKGREVVYVRGQGDDKLHILTAAGDIPFAPAGRRLDLAPDSLLVRASSKYPITEAGVGATIARYGKLLDAVARQQAPGVTLKYLGPVQRPEYPAPLEGVECHFPPGREPDLPQGGKRLVFFDPATRFPVVSLAFDPAGQEVDYSCFDRFQLDVHLDDDDFHPEMLWGPVANTKPEAKK